MHALPSRSFVDRIDMTTLPCRRAASAITAAALSPSRIVATAVMAAAVLSWRPGLAAETSVAQAPKAAPTNAAAAAGVPAPAATTLRSIAIRDGRSDAPDQTIVVAQGAQVELRWRSDRPIALHLHGYDIEARVTPPAPATMTFTARLAGRFPVTEHRPDGRHHRAVAYLEVRP
jgi:hypothetical protein